VLANIDSRSATFVSTVGPRPSAQRIDQDVNVADLLGAVLDGGCVAQVDALKPASPSGRLDLFEDRCAASAVASDDDDVHAIAGEPPRFLCRGQMSLPGKWLSGFNRARTCRPYV
jgi:hypothetical protein